MARRSIGISPGGVDGRIYRSEDGGQTWRQVGAGLPAKHTAMCWQLAYNPYNKNSIFAAFGDVARGHTAGPPGQGAIYVTYDRGDTWEEVALQKRGTNCCDRRRFVCCGRLRMNSKRLGDWSFGVLDGGSRTARLPAL